MVRNNQHKNYAQNKLSGPDLAPKVYYHQDKIKDIKLSDYKGKWVILIFYPGDFTFIRPTELEERLVCMRN